MPANHRVAVVLRAGPVLAAAVSVTVPLPVPDAPVATVNQLGSLLAAVQLHPVVADTAIRSAVPDAAARADDGFNEKRHGAAA